MLLNFENTRLRNIFLTIVMCIVCISNCEIYCEVIATDKTANNEEDFLKIVKEFIERIKPGNAQCDTDANRIVLDKSNGFSYVTKSHSDSNELIPQVTTDDAIVEPSAYLTEDNQKQLKESLGHSTWVCPGCAVFFDNGGGQSTVFSGVKLKLFGKLKEMPCQKGERLKISAFNYELQTNYGDKNFHEFTKPCDHTERQLIAKLISENSINSETTGKICIYAQFSPCFDHNPDNGFFSCFEYYQSLIKTYPKIIFSIYYDESRGNLTFEGKCATSGTFSKCTVENISLCNWMPSPSSSLENRPIKKAKIG